MIKSNNTFKKYKSSTHYILSGLIPYTDANLKLTFKPNQFFNELEKLNALKASKNSIRNNYYRLINRGLIKFNDAGHPFLTKKTHKILKSDRPRVLPGNKKLVVSFDIPEKERSKRDALRYLLRELAFKQVQRSVWETEYDYKEYIKSQFPKYGLSKYVTVYESKKIKI